jgi:3-oxoacyl-[acyl-carrier protein] reductase
MSASGSALRVFITGGGRGIGRAIALRFAREGARVVVAARTSSEIDAVVAEINAAGGQGLPSQVNVRDHGSVEAAIWRGTQFTGGALDVLVNNAGVFQPKPIGEMDLATWERHIEVNLNGAFYVTREAEEALEQGERPHVFNIASMAARQGFADNTAYCAGKYGLRGSGDALREEWRKKGIRVSTVYPGPTNTAMLKSVPGNLEPSRVLQPEQVAEVVWSAYHSDDLDAISDLIVS